MRGARVTVLSFWTQIGRPDYHADFDGGSLTSRTVFPDTFDTALLGPLAAKLRRPHWPGGIPPLRHDELQQFIAAGDPDGWKRLVEADTLRELALKLGVDPDGLEAQVEEFNSRAADGTDPVFHRGETPWELYIQPPSDLPNRAIAPILDPPFIGYTVRTAVFGTKGGPVINSDAQVVGMDGAPIPGLCGAGNAVASIFGAAYPGGGATLGPGVTFGYVAGLTLTS